MNPDDIVSLLNDPNFKPQDFIILRAVITVDDDGMGTSTKQSIPAKGIVVPYGSLGVVRGDVSEMQGSGIEIYTDEPIQTGDSSQNRIADNIVWKDTLFEVTAQDDYSQWGFNTATAVLASPGGRPVA